MKVWGSTINVKKFIPFLSTMLTGFYNIAQSTYFGQLVQEIKKYQSINQSFTIKLNTGFDLPINFGADFNVQTNRIKSEQIEIASAKALKATLGYQLKVGNFYNGTSIYLYRMNSQNFNWIDSEIQYNPTKGSFKYRLIGKNLTDLRAFSNINVSEISTSNFSSSILGRYLLMSVSYSLR